MKSVGRMFLVVYSLLAASGCAERVGPPPKHTMPPELKAALTEATTIELMSLDPERPEVEPEGHLQGWRVLSRMRIDDPGMRAELIRALESGLTGDDLGEALCFNPRHGVSALHGDTRHELVICFECGPVYWYANGMSKGKLLSSDSPQATLDGLLNSARAPVK